MDLLPTLLTDHRLLRAHPGHGYVSGAPTAAASTTFPSICDLLVVRGWGNSIPTDGIIGFLMTLGA